MGKYKKLSHVIYKCAYHIVCVPKYRLRILQGEIKDLIVSDINKLCEWKGCEVLKLNVQEDHVHLLVEVDPQLGIHKLIKRIKGRSSRFLRLEFPHLRSRLPTLWTNSYFVSTVGGAPLEIIKQYVEKQKNV